MANAKTTTKDRTADQVQPGEAPKGNLATAGTTEQKTVHPIVAFKTYADERLTTLETALPPHITPNAFMSVVLTALQKKPDLLKCTKKSLWNACVMAANDGLLPDGREGAIAPYGENENGQKVADVATWMPMVEGLRKKARNSGMVRDWYVEVVYAGDFFLYRKGDDPRLDHEPVPPSRRTGGIIAAYSIAVYTDGTKSAPEVMWIEEIELIRAKSKAKKGPWSDTTFYSEMCKKTVARRHYKALPKSAGMDALILRDDKEFDLDHRSDEAIEQREARRSLSTRAAFDQFANPGPTIEHDDEPTGSDFDGEEQRTDGDGEFDDGGDTDNGREADGGKPPADQQQPQGGQTDAATAQSGEGGGAAQDSAGGDTEQRKWPEGQVPKDQDEYQFYAETIIGGWTRASEFDTGTAKIVGADGMPDWWKSKPERDLRTACGVTKDTFDTLVGKIKDKQAALRKGK